MVSLFTLAYTPTEGGFTLCPGCLRETPSIFASCVQCEGVLISHGCRQSLVQEEAATEHEKTIPEETVIDVQDDVKEAMEKMKEEEESNVEMTDELPEETPQIARKRMKSSKWLKSMMKLMRMKPTLPA